MKDNFNKKAVHPLQSWEWGEFREAWGNKVVRLSNFQIVFSRVPLTNLKIGTVIRGPKPTKKDIEGVKEIAKKENAIFVKFEPNVVADSVKRIADRFFKENRFVKGRRLFTPTSFWINLTKSEDELLKSFHPKTRYNIRLAQRQGVEVVEDNSNEAFEKYLELTKETSKRQGFYAHTEKYHRLMWKFLKPAGIVHLLIAKYKGEIITTWILFAFKDFLYYPYGASTEKCRGVMANNLMMWEAIRLGRSLGLKTFDLWGREEGKGFTKFKEGYNPKVVTFIGTWDLPTSILYWPYRLAEEIRWKLLRLIK
jgi:lipid II:glycine glycyltransferase (peptidoglycan interpeptide bridge formation enzyme)